MKNIERAGTRGLGDLAEQINEEHRRFEGASGAALDHAIRAGELLIEAKARCPRGNWQTWRTPLEALVADGPLPHATYSPPLGAPSSCPARQVARLAA